MINFLLETMNIKNNSLLFNFFELTIQDILFSMLARLLELMPISLSGYNKLKVISCNLTFFINHNTT